MLPSYPFRWKKLRMFGRRRPRSKNHHRRQLGIESLESRRVLTAYINEFQFSPTFGTAEEDQFLEFRGTPGESLEVGTYFVGVESADGVDELGDIHTIIDLSGQTFGENGLLVLLPSASKVETLEGATVLRGGDGFIGMPASFQADHDDNVIHAGTSSYFLVHTTVAPMLDDDIDINDDGLPDSVYSNWTILDSFSIVAWVEGPFNQRTFARIVFAEDGAGDGYLPGSTVVNTDQLAYVGRIGNSTGYLPDEWMAGNTVEQGDNTGIFQLQHGVFGTPRPFAYGGRLLDHVGGHNWYGSLSGAVFQDSNEDGIQQPGEESLDGVDVFLDTNQDGEIDFFWETIEADEYALDSDLSNISSNVTIVSAGADNVHQGFKIRAVQDPGKPDGVHTLAHEGVGFFNNNRRIRMDFYDPVRAVSIDVTGNSDLRATYGRLEIFDRDGNSMAMIRTSPLGDGQLENLTLSRPTADIAWALAYPDDEFMDSSPFGRLDNLRFEVPEREAVVNANGSFNFDRLTANQYRVSMGGLEGFRQVFPSNDAAHEVDVFYQNVSGVNFGLLGDLPPSLDDQTIETGENRAAGTVLATLPVELGYESQKLEVVKISGDTTGLFSVHPETFALTLNRDELNFESQTQHQLVIQLRDTANPDLSDHATITIDVQDRNDKPEVLSKSATIEEHSATETAVATMEATDEDTGPETFVWSIVGGNLGDAFTIDANTGEVSVANSDAVNFESAPTIELEVRATDQGIPVASGTGTLTITLTDINEAPEFTEEQTFEVLENAAGSSAIGTLSASEVDAGQTLSWTLLGGADSQLFNLASDGELTLSENAQLNFEQTTSYELEVQVSDSATTPLSDTGVITISVQDVNDAPKIESQEFELPENSGFETEIGTVSATDEDAGQTISFSITGGTLADAFQIDASSGLLSVAENAILDFESEGSKTVEVTATDNDTSPLSSAVLLTITLQDLNEAPALETESLSFDENLESGTIVGNLSAFDPDAEDQLSFELISQEVDWVVIDQATGEVKISEGAEIDYENLSQNNIVVRVSDQGELASEGTISLLAEDANDAPQVATPISDVETEVGEEFVLSIPTSTFTDQDLIDSLRLTATVNGFPLPDWLQFDTSARVLSGTPTTEDIGTIEVSITAIDDSNASATDSFDLVVKSDAFSWHNETMPLDASNDGALSAVDALLVINYLNQANSAAIPPETTPSFGLVDSTNDGFVTALDALVIINELNTPNGEGESIEYGLEFDSSDPFEAWEDLLSEREKREQELVVGLLARTRKQ